MIVHDVWRLTPEKVAIYLPTETAVLADVHLGYCQARNFRGEALPTIPVAEQLEPLLRVAACHAIKNLVVAGDLFEQRAQPDLIGELQSFLADARLDLLAVVPGNHDRGLEDCHAVLPIHADGFRMQSWFVIHGHRPLPKQKVIHGHIHPCFRLGAKINAPCFLVSKRSIILPAFSADAAGVNVLADPKWKSYRGIVCAGEKLLDFGELARMQRVP